MKKIYKTPEFELVQFRVPNDVLALLSGEDLINDAGDDTDDDDMLNTQRSTGNDG